MGATWSTTACGSRRCARPRRFRRRRRRARDRRGPAELHRAPPLVTGRRSEHALYARALASYGTGETFPHEAAAGFIRVRVARDRARRGRGAHESRAGMTLWAGPRGTALAPEVLGFPAAADDAELLPYDCGRPPCTRAGCTPPGCSTTPSSPRRAGAAQIGSRRAATPGRRGRALGDRAAARRGRAEDPRRPLAQRSGAAALRLYVARRLRARRVDAIDALALGAARARRGRGRDADARLHAPPASAAGHARPSPARLGRDARARSRSLRASRPAGAPSPARRRRAGGLDARRSPPPPRTRCCATRSTLSPTATSRSTTSTRALCSSRTSRGSARSSCFWTTERVRLRAAARQRRHRLVDDAAEAEPRRRRARARQGGHRDRPAGRPARHVKGLPLAYNRDLQEDKAAGLRRPVRRARPSRRSPSSSASSRSTASGWRPPPTRHPRNRRGRGARARGIAVPRRARARRSVAVREAVRAARCRVRGRARRPGGCRRRQRCGRCGPRRMPERAAGAPAEPTARRLRGSLPPLAALRHPARRSLRTHARASAAAYPPSVPRTRASPRKAIATVACCDSVCSKAWARTPRRSASWRRRFGAGSPGSDGDPRQQQGGRRARRRPRG